MGPKIHCRVHNTLTIVSLLNRRSPIGFTSILDILQQLKFITQQRSENCICFRLEVGMEKKGSNMADPLHELLYHLA
jgi:hypothetical protein